MNSFTSVSLDPPLVLMSVARSARAAAHLGHVPFTANVLSAAQLDVALHFAGRLRDPLPVTWLSTGDHLAPTLAGALATFRCHPWHSYDGGDHRLHLGRVVEAAARDDGEPLLFDRGKFWMAAPAYPVRGLLRAGGAPEAAHRPGTASGADPREEGTPRPVRRRRVPAPR